MSSRKNSRSSHTQRVLYTKKGMRRKIYKSVTKKLIEQGVDKSQVDEVIERIRLGKIKLIDAAMMRDVDALARLDADIKRLQELVEKETEKPQRGEE